MTIPKISPVLWTARDIEVFQTFLGSDVGNHLMEMLHFLIPPATPLQKPSADFVNGERFGWEQSLLALRHLSSGESNTENLDRLIKEPTGYADLDDDSAWPKTP